MVGTINFELDGKVVASKPLVVLEEVKQAGFFRRTWEHVLLQFHQWFGKWLN